MIYLVEKPDYKSLIELLKLCGTVVSVLMKPKPVIIPTCDRLPFAELFSIYELMNCVSELGEIKLTEIKFSVLNRFELEGSLISVIAEGGCHRATSDLPLEKIRSSVISGLEAVLPEPFSSVTAYRIEGHLWCELVDSATVSSSYLIYQGARGLWWLLCIADFD